MPSPPANFLAMLTTCAACTENVFGMWYNGTCYSDLGWYPNGATEFSWECEGFVGWFSPFNGCATVGSVYIICLVAVVISLVAMLALISYLRKTPPAQRRNVEWLLIFCLIMAKIKIIVGVASLGLLFSVMGECPMRTNVFLMPVISIVFGLVWICRACSLRRMPPAAPRSDAQTARVGLTTPGAIELGKPAGGPMMKVVVPEGIMPGASFAVQLAGGGFLTVVCPPDKKMGDEIAIHVP